MLTDLETTRLGPITVPAPRFAPRQFAGDQGHMWQWVGGGDELISLSVAVRTTRMGTPTGVRHRLAWEAERVRGELDPGTDSAVDTTVLVMVDGSVGSAAADVDGVQHSLEVHNRLVMTTDGPHLHLVQVMTRDTEGGRELAEVVTAGLEVTVWAMPA